MFNEMKNPDFGKDQLKISIEEVGPDDWEEYKNLRLLALQEEPVAFEDPESGTQRMTTREESEWREMLQGKMRQPGSVRITLWAKEDGAAAGTMNAVIRNYGSFKGAVLQNVYVQNKYRDHGIAKKLMTAMLAKLDGVEGLEVVGLGVFMTQEAAIELYKSFGFQIVQTIQDSMHDGKEYPGQYKMEKAIHQEQHDDSQNSKLL